MYDINAWFAIRMKRPLCCTWIFWQLIVWWGHTQKVTQIFVVVCVCVCVCWGRRSCLNGPFTFLYTNSCTASLYSQCCPIGYGYHWEEIHIKTQLHFKLVLVSCQNLFRLSHVTLAENMKKQTDSRWELKRFNIMISFQVASVHVAQKSHLLFIWYHQKSNGVTWYRMFRWQYDS